MITGCLQQKNGYYYVLLYLKVDGKRKVKWISTKLPVSGTSERKAKRAFDEIRSQFEKENVRNRSAFWSRLFPMMHGWSSRTT